MRILVGLGVLVLVALVGCSTPSGGPGSGAPGSGGPGSAPKQTLASEQRRLAELFKGTPVVVETPREGSLRITVPLGMQLQHGTRLDVLEIEREALARVLLHVLELGR
jgi:hypothetical protein